MVLYMSNADARGFGNRHEQIRGNSRKDKRNAYYNNRVGRGVGNAHEGKSWAVYGIGETCFDLTKAGALRGSIMPR